MSGSLALIAPSANAIIHANVETAAVDLIFEGDSVIVKAKKPMWGKPAAVYEVAPDQTVTLVQRFTPTQNKPTVSIRWLDSDKNYRLESPGIPKPITFRLAIKSTTSTAKADTTPQLPAGKALLNTVTLDQKNSEWYLSPYFFPTLGQTFQVTQPITVTKAAMHFSPAVTTLLTPEGVKLFKNPQNIDWSDPKMQRIEKFNNDPGYSFKTKATFSIYSGVENGLAKTLDTKELTPVAQVTRNATISHNGYLTFDLGSVQLPSGNYFATINLADVPKDIVTVFMDGRNFGGPNSKKDLYPQGQAYRIQDGSQTVFEPHDAKRQPVSSAGRDDFDPGDLMLTLLGK